MGGERRSSLRVYDEDALEVLWGWIAKAVADAEVERNGAEGIVIYSTRAPTFLDFNIHLIEGVIKPCYHNEQEAKSKTIPLCQWRRMIPISRPQYLLHRLFKN